MHNEPSFDTANTSTLIEAYNIADKAGNTALLAAINPVLDQRLKLVEVMPENEALAAQLVGRDRVHEFGAQSVDDLRRYRLGGAGSNKTAFALVNPDGNQMLAVIYVYKTNRPIAELRQIPGNVGRILSKPCSPMDGVPTSFVFFSISSTEELRKAGAKLVAHLFDDEPAGLRGAQPVYSTLSPLRTLRGHFEQAALKPNDFDGLRKLALSHLLANRDPVQKFHLNNGASIGDIKLRANKPDSRDATDGMGVMVNYVYAADRAVRQQNQAIFRAGDIAGLLAPELRDRLVAGPHAKPYRPF